MSLTFINLDPTVVVDYGTVIFEIEENVNYLLERGKRFLFEPSIMCQGVQQSFTGKLSLVGVKTSLGPYEGLIDCPAELTKLGMYRLQIGDDVSKAIDLTGASRLTYVFKLEISWMQKSGNLQLARKTASDTNPTVASKTEIATYADGINGVIKYYFNRVMQPATFPSRPEITGVANATMKVGDTNVIYGSGLGKTKGSLYIGSYTMLDSSILSWTDTNIVIKPQTEDANNSGILKVYRPDIDQVSDSKISLTIAPKILPVIDKTNYTNNTTRRGIIQKLVITGVGFGETEGSVFIGAKELAVLAWSNNRVEASITADIVTGNLALTTGSGDISNLILMTFLDSTPEIDFVIPDTCTVNGNICITGRNFGNSVGNIIVGDLGATLDITTWTDTYIVATAPNGTSSGNAKVVTGAKLESNSKPLAIVSDVVNDGTTPIISRMTPPGGPSGTQVVITGTNFGAYRSGVCYITIGSLNMEIVPSAWSDTSVTCKVPLNAKTDYVKINTQYGISNEALFIVADEALPSDVIIHPKVVSNTSAPTISYTEPVSAGHGGTKLTIYGNNFGRTVGSVKFGSYDLAVVTNSWTKNSVQVYLPDFWSTLDPANRPQNMVLRDLLYLNNSNGYSNKIAFTVMSPAPVITAIAPTAPKVGDTVTITGKYFGAGIDTENNYLRFGSTEDRLILRGNSAIKAWSDTSITFIAPDSIDYSMKCISVVADKVKSEWYSINVAYIDSSDPDPVSIGDIKNEYGQLIAPARRNVPPIIGVPTGAPTVPNLNTDKWNGRHWEDVVEMVNDAKNGSKLIEKLSTINGVSPNAQNNIKLCGSGNVEVIPNPDANEIIISGTPLESGEAQLSSNVIVNYGGIVGIKGEDGVIVTNNNGVVTLSLDIGMGVNQVVPGDHNHSGNNNYVVYA